MMSSISLVDLAHTYGGVLWQMDESPEVRSVSIDSRKLKAGDCFVAIKGDRFDAHDFVDEVVERGATSLVVEKPQQKKVLQWVVPDAVEALGQIAHENRKQFDHPLIAITGSNGKTSVKEMLASILGLSGQVLATRGNLNNHIGVPLTLLDLTQAHEFAVIEMGASALGEIEYLCSLAQPDIALVNNVGEAHMEKFGSAENIYKAKGEIYAGVKEGGTAVVNLDSKGAAGYIDSLKNCNYLTFSADEENTNSANTHGENSDVRATDIQLNNSGSEFTLWIADKSAPVALDVPAQHNVSNALAAASCAHALDIPLEQIVRGLQEFSGVKGRLQFLDGINGARLIDDSYNASPTSARAAADFLAALDGKRVFVLGDMGELGDDKERLHAELGKYLADSGVDLLAATGALSQFAVDAFGDSGIGSGIWCETQAELVDQLKAISAENVTMLVKGSRSAAMDQVVAKLVKQEEER